MKPLATVLLLVALVGAGWAEQRYYIQRTVSTDMRGNIIQERRELLEAKVMSVTEYEDGLTATSEVLVPVPPEAVPMFSPGLSYPPYDPCAHGDHDWRDTEWLLMGERMDVENVRVQACSRCGLLRVRP